MVDFILKQISIIFIFYITILFLSKPAYAQLTPIPSSTGWVDFGLVIDGETYGTGWDTFFEGLTPGNLVKKNNTYFLYYTGADDYISQIGNEGPAHRAVGVATSTDGVHWTKYNGNPILTYTLTGNPEEGAIAPGVFIDTNGVFHIYYGINFSESPISPMVHANVRYATSSDGYNFTEQGTVLEYTNTSVWGYGDELHGIGSWKHDNTYFAFYRPNGTAQSGKLAVAWGTNPSHLISNSAVLQSGSTISANVLSIIPLDSTTLAYFTTYGKVTTVRTVSTSDLKTVSAPVQTYSSLPGTGKAYYLDKTKRTWLAIYNQWAYMGLMMAPDGAIDSTGPIAPNNLNVSFPDHSKAALSWSPSSDPETGVVLYNVYREGTKIGSTKSFNFTDSGLMELTQYNYAVKPVNYHNIEGAAAILTVRTPLDTSKPVIKSVGSGGDSNIITLVFNEALNKTSSENIAHYSINNGISINSAVLETDQQTVILNTSPLTNNRLYTVSAVNIADLAATPNFSNSSVDFTYSSVSGLAGYWRMEVDSPGNDSSGFNGNGVIKGNPGWVTGLVGKSLSLNGINDYLEIDNTPFIDSSFSKSFTVTGWFLPSGVPLNTNSSNGKYALFAGPNVRILYDYQQKFFAETTIDTATINVVSAVLPPDVWYFACMITDDIAKIIKLNLYNESGSLVSSTTKNYTGTLRQLPIIGAGSNNDEYYSRFRIGVQDPSFNYDQNYFKGLIDDVRVYNKALTPAEITQIAAIREQDITPTPSLHCQPLGDLNCDGRVNIFDFAILVQNFGTVIQNSDLNNDRKVNMIDLSLLLINFGINSGN